jgi:acetyl-CoA acetyltransferase
MTLDAAIVGIGTSKFGRSLPESQLALAAIAFKNALADAGLERAAVDGLSIHLGWPLGPDYDRVAEAFGLDIRYVNQSWLHGRFVTNALQHAALAVSAGLANVVACVTAVSFTRERGFLGGPGDVEGNREEGGTHGEAPPYGLTAPAGGAAIAMQRYMHLYGATSAQLAAVPIAMRKHASQNPAAIMRSPLTLEAHQAARMVVDPLRLFDCCLISDGAAVVLLARGERARDLRQKPVHIAGMQGTRAGREEFIFAPRGLGINQQSGTRAAARPVDMEVFAQAGVSHADVDGFYTYDAFSPLVLFALERFGYCGPGEAAAWVQDGRIELGGRLPINTSGGLLSEAHVAGWNSICEMTRQLRGTAGATQIPGARLLHWGTAWGDAVMMTHM